LIETQAGDASQSYEQLLRERDELQSMLGKFERHMAEIQANVKVLTKERDKTNLLYEQVGKRIDYRSFTSMSILLVSSQTMVFETFLCNEALLKKLKSSYCFVLHRLFLLAPTAKNFCSCFCLLL